MKTKAFVSFRFEDGIDLKDEIIEELKKKDLIIDKSESVDRSNMSEESIQEYLYEKLRDTSITIVIITPKAINYKKNWISGLYDDWLYDELRYSLYERKGNTLNGVVAIYTDEAKSQLMYTSTKLCNDCNSEHTSQSINGFDNLVRMNMMNVKKTSKKNPCEGYYDSEYDSYISLVPYNDFKSNPKYYIDIALEKRNDSNNYNIVKRM
ncbi:molecular chaperone Tir [Candidatus Izimaplasma bacterium ZiA1]|uniref:TIR domain-containing protein n=1 Tax=Candidatus Izimoplasma sp. ZiA1 TaxID=2024899 RepID=UPI000BAA5787|nr:molecular chaperone Tir [Candidatus Izimaplasma bacterium ZiA1]